MIFDVLFEDIFISLNEIILKICEDLPILIVGLSQLNCPKNLVDIGVDIVLTGDTRKIFVSNIRPSTSLTRRAS